MKIKKEHRYQVVVREYDGTNKFGDAESKVVSGNLAQRICFMLRKFVNKRNKLKF